MAVRIRLTRVGRKGIPLWRIAVFDRLTRRDGRYLDNLGTYDPREEPKNKVKLDMDGFNQWVSKGAKPSESLERILKHTGHLQKK